jgi:ABC-type Fe3+ transport system substrate-binding protein
MKQQTEWVVKGTYPIALGIYSSVVAEYQKNKLPIERLFPEDGPNTFNVGSAGVILIKGAPHPNAAKLLANWLLTKESVEIYEKYLQKPSSRKDTSTKEFVVDFIKVKPDVKYAYLDTDPKFYFNYKLPLSKKILEILGGP